MSRADAVISPPTTVLSRGSHPSRSEGMCLVEFAAWLAGETHSAHPECVSLVIGEFCRVFNDTCGEERTELLASYGPRIVGTNAGLAVESRRSWMALDWLVRSCLPTLATAAGAARQASRLAGLDALTPRSDLNGIWALLDAVRQELPAVDTNDSDLLVAGIIGVDAAWAASAMTAWWSWYYDIDACLIEAVRVTAFDLCALLTILAGRPTASGATASEATDSGATASGVTAAGATVMAGLRSSALHLLDAMIAVRRQLEPAVAERLAQMEVAA